MPPFTAILTLLWWSGAEPATSLSYICSFFSNPVRLAKFASSHTKRRLINVKPLADCDVSLLGLFLFSPPALSLDKECIQRCK